VGGIHYGQPVINTTGHNNGVLVLGSTSEIEGLTVEDALGGGIVSNVFWHVGTPVFVAL
jgi:hypothetical protein